MLLTSELDGSSLITAIASTITYRYHVLSITSLARNLYRRYHRQEATGTTDWTFIGEEGISHGDDSAQPILEQAFLLLSLWFRLRYRGRKENHVRRKRKNPQQGRHICHRCSG